MNCELCKFKFDYSDHKPCFVISCKHIYCYLCLTKKDKCPKCNIDIDKISIQWRFLFSIISKLNDSAAYYNVGNLLSSSGDYRSAIDCYSKAIDLEPNYLSAYNNKGNCFSQLEDYSSALKCYDRAIQIDPNCIDAYCNKGNVFNNLKDFNEAIKYYNICVKIDPTYKMAYKYKANALQEQRDFPAAVKWYNKAIEMSPNDFDLFVSKGIFKMLYLIFFLN
jgi:tetratricopeptide (TPR) repeat protein